MAVIIPVSNAAQYASGGVLAPTAANFPAVKHFWSCPQSDIGKDFGSGTGGLTDLFGVCHLLKSSGVALAAPAAPDGFSVFPNQANAGTTLSGTLAAIPTATTSVFLLAVMKTAAGGLGLGDATNGASLSLVSSGTNAIQDTSATAYACTAFTSDNTKIYGRGLIVNTWNDGTTTAGHGMQSVEATGNTTITSKTITATTGATVANMAGWGATNKWAAGSTILNFYGAMLIYFSFVPTASFIAGLVAWHTYQWGLGNKWLSSQLKGLT